MGIVNFLHEIGHRELQLMQPETARFVARSELQARSEVKQNIGGLRDHQLACFEKRRRKRRAFVASTVHHREHAVHAAGFARDIVIGRAGIFKREPDEFAAALNFRPIEQLIAHRSPQAGSAPRRRELGSPPGTTARGHLGFN